MNRSPAGVEQRYRCRRTSTLDHSRIQCGGVAESQFGEFGPSNRFESAVGRHQKAPRSVLWVVNPHDELFLGRRRGATTRHLCCLFTFAFVLGLVVCLLESLWVLDVVENRVDIEALLLGK